MRKWFLRETGESWRLERTKGLKKDGQVLSVTWLGSGMVRNGKIVACGQCTAAHFSGFAENLKSSTTGITGLWIHMQYILCEIPEASEREKNDVAETSNTPEDRSQFRFARCRVISSWQVVCCPSSVNICWMNNTLRSISWLGDLWCWKIMVRNWHLVVLYSNYYSVTAFSFLFQRNHTDQWHREAWHAAIHGVAKSRTWLSNWTELNSNSFIPETSLWVDFGQSWYWHLPGL